MAPSFLTCFDRVERVTAFLRRLVAHIIRNSADQKGEELGLKLNLIKNYVLVNVFLEPALF